MLFSNLNKHIYLRLFVVILPLLLMSIQVKSSEPAKTDSVLVSKVESCSKINNDQSRLNCFDSILTKPQTQQAIKNNTEDELPSTLGGKRFGESAKVDEGSLGQLVNCKQSNDGRWFFIFKNGQIWKQVNHARNHPRYRQCNQSVVITKDGFGYKMLVDEWNAKIRVRRHK